MVVEGEPEAVVAAGLGHRVGDRDGPGRLAGAKDARVLPCPRLEPHDAAKGFVWDQRPAAHLDAAQHAVDRGDGAINRVQNPRGIDASLDANAHVALPLLRDAEVGHVDDPVDDLVLAGKAFSHGSQ